MYYSRNSTLTINGGLNGQALRLHTRELYVTLDYETAHMIVRFPISSLESDIDSINVLLSQIESDVVFNTQLGLQYIATEDHPPLNFGLEGWLSIEDSKSWVCGNGEMHHIKNPTYECMFGMVLTLNLKDLNLNIPIVGLDENFEVVMTQALLHKDKN
jgi:hypothetical protein